MKTIALSRDDRKGSQRVQFHGAYLGPNNGPFSVAKTVTEQSCRLPAGIIIVPPGPRLSQCPPSPRLGTYYIDNQRSLYVDMIWVERVRGLGEHTSRYYAHSAYH